LILFPFYFIRNYGIGYFYHSQGNPLLPCPDFYKYLYSAGGTGPLLASIEKGGKEPIEIREEHLLEHL